jgi:hypothetical protein
MRTWVETGYNDIKRGLWDWHHSKMLTASRIERLWLSKGLLSAIKVRGFLECLPLFAIMPKNGQGYSLTLDQRE